MPRQTIFGGIVVIAIVGIIFVITAKKDIPADKTLPEKNASLENTQTLKDLLRERTPITCNFEGNMGEMNIKGTVYVANGIVRGDYLMTSSTTQTGTETHMIMDDTAMRYWTDISTQGFKTIINPTTLEPNKTLGTQSMSYNQDFEYRCSPWVIDASKFVPPSTILFTDLDIALSATPGNTLTGSKAQQCASCDLIPDTGGKTQCRIALQCN